MKKTSYLFLAALVLAILSVSGFGQKKEDFEIKKINVRVYDNEKDLVTTKQTNVYGNGMDIFLSILLSQNVDAENDYIVTVEGFGPGRENEAEGKVEDHRIKETKSVKFYVPGDRYIPFILEFPCVDDTTYTVTVIQKSSGKKVSKSVKTKLGFCYLN